MAFERQAPAGGMGQSGDVSSSSRVLVKEKSDRAPSVSVQHASPRLGGEEGVDTKLRQQFGESPLFALRLNKDLLLNTRMKRLVYKVIEWITRLTPCVYVFGSTVGLAICIFCRFRWGVLLALTMFSSWTCTICLISCVCAIRGFFQVWANDNVHWQQMWRNERPGLTKVRSANEMDAAALEEALETTLLEDRRKANGIPSLPKSESGGSINDLSTDVENLHWNDVFHVVILASYATPVDVMAATLEALARYSDAKSRMGVVLGLEQREKNIHEKAADLISRFADSFVFITAAFHPPNLPGHIKGKASNMCWAFQELACKVLQDQGFTEEDLFRIIVTNIDDDTEFHDNYFDALTYHFLTAKFKERYETLWQPPVVHFKNIVSQPALVRVGSFVGCLVEFARHGNPCDFHTLFSSNSASFLLLQAVGGYDPGWVSDDWHMQAKCVVMTEGRVKCVSIMLPVINLMPEDDTCCSTLKARFTQVCRHSLGIGEIVYLSTQMYLAVLECPTWGRALRALYRTAPLLCRFCENHLPSTLYTIWPPFSFASQYIANLWFGADVATDQIVLNSFLAFVQTRAIILAICCAVLNSMIAQSILFLLVHRVDNNQTFWLRHRVFGFLRGLFEIPVLLPFQQLFYQVYPEWSAAVRIIFSLKIDHAVASMIGRQELAEEF